MQDVHNLKVGGLCFCDPRREDEGFCTDEEAILQIRHIHYGDERNTVDRYALKSKDALSDREKSPFLYA